MKDTRMSASEDPVGLEPTDMFLHDLRRFLHEARDQHDVLLRIAEAITKASDRMEGQEVVVKRVFHTLKSQVEAGVTVNIDADLKAHAARVSGATAPLVFELVQTTKMIRRLSIMIATVGFFGGFIGGLAGVAAALHLI